MNGLGKVEENPGQGIEFRTVEFRTVELFTNYFNKRLGQRCF